LTPGWSQYLDPQDPAAPVSEEVLRFEFDPSPQDVFKAALIKNKRAMRIIHYQDGRTEDWPWNASKFRETSDLSRIWLRRASATGDATEFLGLRSK
jgi:hypothetical protein